MSDLALTLNPPEIEEPTGLVDCPTVEFVSVDLDGNDSASTTSPSQRHLWPNRYILSSRFGHLYSHR